jgi:NadR type nicotinamide-nucleotide adenylyltransferase
MEETLTQLPSNIIKVVLYGPESTGKTTLAKALAAHFNTTWIPEFARDYLQEKWNQKRELCTLDDLLPIAKGQMRLENEGLEKANQWMFCDTNVLTTAVYSEIYYNSCDVTLLEAAKTNEYDLYLLTDIDVPWEKDDLRDKPNEREVLLKNFKSALDKYELPYILLSGGKQARLKRAINILTEYQKFKAKGFSSKAFLASYHEQNF